MKTSLAKNTRAGNQTSVKNDSTFVKCALVCRIPGHRDAVATALRDTGIDAGINYPPLTDSFPRSLADQVSPSAEQWGQEVLNLWLSADYDADRIGRAVAVLERVLDRS